MDYPEDNDEFQLQWTSRAGQKVGVDTAISLLNERASNAFIRGQDETANALRGAAKTLQAKSDDLSRQIDGFIAEEQRRNADMRKKLGGVPQNDKAEARRKVLQN